MCPELAGKADIQDRERLCAEHLAQKEEFIKSDSVGLAVVGIHRPVGFNSLRSVIIKSPEVCDHLPVLQIPDRSLPAVAVRKADALDDAAAGKTDESRLHIRKRIEQVPAEHACDGIVRNHGDQIKITGSGDIERHHKVGAAHVLVRGDVNRVFCPFADRLYAFLFRVGHGGRPCRCKGGKVLCKVLRRLCQVDKGEVRIGCIQRHLAAGKGFAVLCDRYQDIGISPCNHSGIEGDMIGHALLKADPVIGLVGKTLARLRRRKAKVVRVLLTERISRNKEKAGKAFRILFICPGAPRIARVRYQIKAVRIAVGIAGLKGAVLDHLRVEAAVRGKVDILKKEADHPRRHRVKRLI